MTQTPTGAAQRRAFTLVELLVVLVIIGILVSLISYALVRGLGAGKSTRNRVDISQLDTAIEQFKQRYGFYPPSRIKLCEKKAYYFTVPADQKLDTDSIQYLTQMFPRMASADSSDVNFPWTYSGTNTWVDWNGNNTLDTTGMILEGDQCLVFFLGGIPANVGTGVPQLLGFSTNPKNPADATTFDRTPLFFDFQSSRLVYGKPGSPTPTPLHPSAPGFYSYLDTYGSSDGNGLLIAGQPYAYFSSYRTANGYNRYFTSTAPFSDCQTLGVWPYAETVTPRVKYLRSDKYQIISAGPDQLFGSGSVPTIVMNSITLAPLWTPATAATVNPSGSPGNDDQSNFSSTPLGSGQE